LQRHGIRLLAGCGCARIGVDGESGWDLLAAAVTGHYLLPAASPTAAPAAWFRAILVRFSFLGRLVVARFRHAGGWFLHGFRR